MRVGTNVYNPTEASDRDRRAAFPLDIVVVERGSSDEIDVGPSEVNDA